jgi:hypothetical protein
MPSSKFIICRDRFFIVFECKERQWTDSFRAISLPRTGDRASGCTFARASFDCAALEFLFRLGLNTTKTFHYWVTLTNTPIETIAKTIAAKCRVRAKKILATRQLGDSGDGYIFGGQSFPHFFSAQIPKARVQGVKESSGFV